MFRNKCKHAVLMECLVDSSDCHSGSSSQNFMHKYNQYVCTNKEYQYCHCICIGDKNINLCRFFENRE